MTKKSKYMYMYDVHAVNAERPKLEPCLRLISTFDLYGRGEAAFSFEWGKSHDMYSMPHPGWSVKYPLFFRS